MKMGNSDDFFEEFYLTENISQLDTKNIGFGLDKIGRAFMQENIN